MQWKGKIHSKKKKNMPLEIREWRVIKSIWIFTWAHLRFLEEHSLDLCLWLLRAAKSGEKDQRSDETLLLSTHWWAYMQMETWHIITVGQRSNNRILHCYNQPAVICFNLRNIFSHNRDYCLDHIGVSQIFFSVIHDKEGYFMLWHSICKCVLVYRKQMIVK
jgi:hypothetical protein